MATIEQAIERIKALECPTGDVKDRVRKILTDYNVASKSEIMVTREHSLDKKGARGYNAKISGEGETDIVVLALSGRDDYVAKVMDVYIS
ncbi:hypothetical protein [Pelosinus sp. IPA-1]|uniref:hypothetical protein n=1 Tax=Pelosinus sp. IPA-1 TaxID=3029569 RepID=UPI0024362066|nr:hypothetical protein [Pelosinus sp. IPA-1]GMA98953.1 hypothetical protein PIPA1_17530 [Pelosinus sp. IPA-1]